MVLLSVCSGRVDAQEREPDSEAKREILLGMSTALTGPASQLGQDMLAGVNAALQEANRSGGIHGRPLRCIALDDGYEPLQTAPNMQRLIKQHEVLAVIGNVGTPTAVMAVPIANREKTLLFGAYTGAGILRKTPPDRYIINYRASYAEATGAMVDALVQEAGLRLEEIAFFTQRDAYGDAGYAGGISAMKRWGLQDEHTIVHGRYTRNTDAVENGLAEIISSRVPIRAVIMVGTYVPCVRFIKLAREIDFNPIFLNVSFVGAKPLAKALGKEGTGVIITQVVPHIDSDLPIVNAYRDAMAALDRSRELTFTSLEGYIACSILLKALRAIDGEPTRENIVTALESLGQFDIGLDEPLELTPDQHQASHRTWPTMIRNGAIIPIRWSQLQELEKQARR